MIIREYRIARIDDSESINQWQILLQLEPSWFDRTFRKKTRPKVRALIGSCLTWHWGDGNKANYRWSMWAFNAVRKRVGISQIETYVNCRFTKQEDK